MRLANLPGLLLLAVAVVLASALAGCTGSSGDAPPPAVPGTATVAPIATATPTPTATATATPTATPAPGTCTQTTLGVDPATNTELAADCAALLAAKAALADAGTLNWSADTAITDWDGVTLGGTPQRVTGLSLMLQGLKGAIPAELGSLTGLRSLDLSQNRLTGGIPSELEGLSSLSALFLGENQLTGCLPVGLLAVASHDLASLGLEETCAPPPTTNLPYNLHTTGTVTAPGSYAFLSDVDNLGSTVSRYIEGATFGLLIHQSDSGGASRAALYDTVAAGDTVDWWRAEECSIRFLIPEVQSRQIHPWGSPA